MADFKFEIAESGGGSNDRRPRYWRSLEELADTPAFREMLHREFPRQASEWLDPVGRREFLKLMTASLGLAGLTSCTRQPTEKIMPYVRAPEEIVPGKPLFYATALPFRGYGMGVLVESHMGRPTKIEGNPQHPASRGATDAFAQASVLTLYDPDRSQTVVYGGRINTWERFTTDLREAMASQTAKRGAGLRILTETVTSPTLAHQIRTLLEALPEARWHQYESVSNDNVLGGMELAFGQPVGIHYDFAKADVILSLDADFLLGEPASVRYARDFASKRQVTGDGTHMNRLYVAECATTLTGAMADHRLAVRASEVKALAKLVANGVSDAVMEGEREADRWAEAGGHKKWIEAVVKDLRSHRGSSIVLAGCRQSPGVHATAHWINRMLGNFGKTLIYTDAVEPSPVKHLESLRELTKAMAAGRVEMLIILGGNPVFTAPADLEFGEHLSRVKFKVHLGLYEDETAQKCQWHVPQAHELEAWGDVRAYEGTVSIIQPLIEPLYGGKSAHELLAAMRGEPDASGYEIVREYWRGQHRGDDFEMFWRRTLHDGIMAGTSLPGKTPPQNPAINELSETSRDWSGLEINFAPDPTIWDGRFSNNGWLQELPKPLTKLTWDNAVLLSPHTAKELQLLNEDLVELRLGGRSVRGPVWILPGHADGAVTVHLGYGRTRAGRVGERAGFRVEDLRTSDAFWFGPGLEIRKTGQHHKLACTQDHHSMEGRPIVRAATLSEFMKNPHFAHEGAEHPSPEQSLLPAFKYEGYAWGMAVNQNACIGCNACVIACQAENNIPVVGKQQVSNGREMHWLRIDEYHSGSPEEPEHYFQPMLCQHCEKAPCETVCPVAATVHDSEGLNTMVYNRCVGTRYCSNNCPYKVRRFNFLQYADLETPVLKMLRNPDVTVRTRGVMEKCTYCVQRISAARIQAEKEERHIHDGEVVTACQGACPTQAIVFGDINDPESRVSKLKRDPLNYSVLGELNTQPRTTYLAKLTNPNPAMETK